jgi:hypothetical protein
MSNSARSLSLVSNSDSILFHTSPHVIVLMPANSGTAHSSGAAKISFLSSSKSKESGKPGSFSRVKNRNSASFTRLLRLKGSTSQLICRFQRNGLVHDLFLCAPTMKRMGRKLQCLDLVWDEEILGVRECDYRKVLVIWYPQFVRRCLLSMSVWQVLLHQMMGFLTASTKLRIKNLFEPYSRSISSGESTLVGHAGGVQLSVLEYPQFSHR